MDGLHLFPNVIIGYEAERVLPFVPSLNAPMVSTEGHGLAKPRAKNSINLPSGFSGSSAWTIIVCLPRCRNRKLDQERNSWGVNLGPDMESSIAGCGRQSCGLAAVPSAWEYPSEAISLLFEVMALLLGSDPSSESWTCFSACVLSVQYYKSTRFHSCCLLPAPFQIADNVTTCVTISNNT